MHIPAKQDYTYTEFTDYARRFSQVDLLAGIARIAAALPDGPASAYTPARPWALAGLAKASIVHGNPYRTIPARPQDITLGCAIFDKIKPGQTDDAARDPLFNILTRMAYEQFAYQESPGNELARAESLFNGYSGRKPLQVLNTAGVNELLGAPVRDAAGVAIMLAGAAFAADGFFDPAVLDHEDYARVLEELPKERILSVIDTCFVTDIADFRRRNKMAPQLTNLDQYMFNPLTSRPFLRLDDGRLLAPVPQLIPRRLSPIEFYYDGLGRWDRTYMEDMGELFEDYVGRQLQDLPDVTVHSEILYGGKSGKEKKSIDWIVVFDDLVLLVEAKAARVDAAGRAGTQVAKRPATKTLSDAFEQIDVTHEQIMARTKEFSHIPTDRPFIGLVATLDPWYTANFGAPDFPYHPQVPCLTAPIRSIETLIGIGRRRSASEVLKQIAASSQLSTWDLGAALHDFQDPTDTNPILMAAYAGLPFNPQPDQAATM